MTGAYNSSNSLDDLPLNDNNYPVPYDNVVLVGEVNITSTVTSKDMPALGRSYDDVASRAQRTYLASQKRLLYGLVAVAITSGVGQLAPVLSKQPQMQHNIEVGAAVTGAVLFGLCLWLAAKQQTSAKAEDWYDARALAESVKSMAWKYMMEAEPYVGVEADKTFVSDLRKLLTDAQKRPLIIGDDGDQITETMRKVRKNSPSERLSVYQRDRIGDQRKWYKRRSEEHDKANRHWQLIVTLTLGIALALGILSVLVTPLGAVAGIAAAIAPSAIAWNQTHRHRELAHSYAFTSHEIGLTAVSHSENISRFVADCENAFSREHTMWRARREASDI